MKFFIVVFTVFILSVVFELVLTGCDYSFEPIISEKPTSNKGFIFEANNMTCLTNVNVTDYKYDLWYPESKYYPKLDVHLICCEEPFSPDTIIPSLMLEDKSSLEIIQMDFDILAKGKTNCSIYYGQWFCGKIPSNAFIPITGTTLTIHPLTIRTLSGR